MTNVSARRSVTTRPATFRFAGIEQRVEALFDPDGLSIVGVSKQNHPDTASAMTAAFDEVVAERSTNVVFKLSFRTPDFRKASIGWLRAAYLVAFATLGYRYILREELEEVRQQIRDPAAEILKRYCVITQKGPADRCITFVSEPARMSASARSTRGRPPH